MKFLICGLGSIGKRHMENLESLGYKCEDIGVYRTNKGTQSFGDNLLTDHYNRHRVHTNLEEALACEYDVAFITNPTSLHVKTALETAKARCHLFIEKPLSHTMDGVDELIKCTDARNLKSYVAYNFRFHPLLMCIKKYLDNNLLGKIISVHAKLSERITKWHSWENYSISYASRKCLGGGVVLTQSHEIDYLYWFFGKPEWVFAAGGKQSNLDIDVEDSAEIIMQFKNKTIAYVHLDYIKDPPERSLEIIGTHGNIHCDFFKSSITVNPQNNLNETLQRFDRNDMYIEELQEFLDCIKNDRETPVDLKQGKDVLKILLAIKRSMIGNL